MIEQWLNEQPDANTKDMFLRLQANTAEVFQPGQLRTLQRRVRAWRSEIARRLVLGVDQEPGRDSACSVAIGTVCASAIQD